MSEASKFDAGSVVEDLEWDFTKYGAGQGVVPEPSDKEYGRFQRRMTGLVKDSGLEQLAGLAQRMQRGEEPDLQELTRLMASLPEDALENLNDAMVEIIADFTKGSPSREQLLALPMRPRQAFFGWLMGQFSPKTLSAGTKVSLAVPHDGETLRLRAIT